MKQLFYNALLSILLVTVFLCSTSVSGGQLENRAAPASPPAIKTKRPPFNGSIFGKRSGNSESTGSWLRRANRSLYSPSSSSSSLNLFRADGVPFEAQQPEVSSSLMGKLILASRQTPVEQLANLVLQLEPPIRAALRQCSEEEYLRQLANLGEQSLTDALCVQLLANASGSSLLRASV